ncbi:MAG: dienelactone hydrolase family protein [Candidatus Krumholzibacteria bacterium]|nr:dienelactone hydrolase family protein [Candidatus Krumholzibacteria bacterium]
MRVFWIFLVVLCLAGAVAAEVRVEPIEYKQGDTTLRGQIAYDDAAKGKRPGILVVHEWWGLNDYAKERAKMLAEAGYVAFAVDMYGEGKTTEHPQEAGEWATAIRMNQKLGAERFNAAYKLLAADARVDAGRMAAIGYCFGGSVVLTMAMNGADLAGVASFHGGLPTEPAPGKVTASILVCHGAADGFATPEQVATFQKNLADAGADWEFISYGGAKHSFTSPDADKRGIPGLAYNEKADMRSWAALMHFLTEVFE